MNEKLVRVMVVEDEPSLRMVARVALEKVGGFVVEECSSGAEALTQAKASLPQLILLDVMMPGMDGPSTMRALRELPETRHIPIVFLTAKVLSREVNELSRSGVLGVLAKPFDPMVLSEQVQRLWSQAVPRTE